MSLSEFELIERFFKRPQLAHGQGVILGIGDDCALLNLHHGEQMAISLDTMVAGVHFPLHAAPRDIGYRLLASNLSDLAAMGAEPMCFTLGLTLPQVEETWLEGFSQGLAELAQQYHLALVGGDTTRGPLTLSIQVHGRVPAGQALRRDGAMHGDLIYVSGTLGDAAAGLAYALAGAQPSEEASGYLWQRFYRPSPRLELGMRLRPYASAVIDISDGLLADLGHVLKASHMGADLQLDSLPLSEALRSTRDAEQALQLALCGGEDFELCFTVSPQEESQMLRALQHLSVPVTRIGQVHQRTGLRLWQGEQSYPLPAQAGYQHF
ncbi:thiamine-phosphate kinase [Balneatrix alpica]|uniref:thiamine-phosphate kinase n=1 Tax=Balneatrix alpica TaxID=75684 RepID=UPI00273886A8|nr:thiamine-phosphate kinase [Balneatrix alpica]